jgi:carboxypeptidase family protein/TonB-dependent receptor-like protein
LKPGYSAPALALQALGWIAFSVVTLENARGQSAQLSGQVRDPSGAAVSEVYVTVINLDSGLRRTTSSGIDGSYAVSSLPEGEYKVTALRPGFRTVARLGVHLSAADAARLDFDLQIGSMQEFITIEGGSTTINVEDASSGVRFDDEAARRLPVNGRTLQGLISLAPGVLATPATLGEAGQFSVNGQRPNANYFVTDGVSSNSGVGAAGLPGQFPGGTLPAMTALGTLQGLAVIGEVREVQVKTSTFAPEFGRMPGAQVLVNTHAGSNSFHGEASHAFRHERLGSRDWFAQRAGLARAPLRLNDLNAGLGGPVQKNKMFFFTSAEMLRIRQPTAWRTPTPSSLARDRSPDSATFSLLDAFPRPERDLSGLYGESTLQTAWPGKVTAESFRIDRSLAQTGALFVRYHEARSTNRVGLVQQNESRFGTRSFTAGITHHPGLTTVNDVRLNFSRTTVESSWYPGLPGEAALHTVRALLGSPAPSSRPLYGLSVGGLGQLVWSEPDTSRQGQFQLTDTLAISSGRHQIRIGADYLRLTPSRKGAIATALARFDSLDDLLAQSKPQTVYAEAPGGSSLIEIVSAFAQDTWSASERLNVTYGLRWDYMPPPASRVAPAPLQSPPVGSGDGSSIDPAPRGGAATPGPNPAAFSRGRTVAGVQRQPILEIGLGSHRSARRPCVPFESRGDVSATGGHWGVLRPGIRLHDRSLEQRALQ